MSDLYETDVVLWSERQADLLRRRAAGELINDASLDWPNIAEEIESSGKSLSRELTSYLRTILEHLGRLTATPATEPRAGWRLTVMRVRDPVEDILAEAPSLRPKLEALIEREAKRARLLVAARLDEYGETPRVPIDSLTFSVEQTLGSWFPDD